MKKFYSALLIMVMTITLTAVGASAKEHSSTENSTSSENLVVDVDLTNLTTEKIKSLNDKFTDFQINPVYSDDLQKVDGEVWPMAIEIEVNKPIAGVGYIDNIHFYDVIQAYNRGSGILNTIDSVFTLRISNTSMDIAKTITSSIAGWGVHPFTQYLNTGVDMYAVSLFASGHSPSLTTEEYRYMSAAPLIFVYRSR